MTGDPLLQRAVSLANLLASEFAEYAIGQTSANDVENLAPLHPQDDWLGEYDKRVVDEELRVATRTRFVTKHYSDAVESGIKALNECVRVKAGSTLDGDALMTEVFSPNSPKVRVPKSLVSKNEQSEQKGHMMLCQGVVAAWRNPRAHKLMDDDPDATLMMLELVQHLMVTTRGATRTKAKKK